MLRRSLAVAWGVATYLRSTGGSEYIPRDPPATGTPVDPEPPEVPRLPDGVVYEAAHEASVIDLRDDTLIELASLTISTDEDSAYWTLQAQAGDEVFRRLTSGEQPAQLLVTLDGVAWRFAVDTVTRSRSLPKTQASIVGRSVTIAAGSPYQPVRQWSCDTFSTAAQIAAYAMVYTGVEVDWRVEDWDIPATAFSLSGSPIDVVRRLAATIEAIVESDPVEPKLIVRPRYAVLTPKWPAVAPDAEVSVHAVLVDSLERADQPSYDGVYLAGQQSGVLGFCRWAGTTGSVQHPLVTDQLLTGQPAIRQRGTVILCRSGAQANIQMQLPLLVGPGRPGLLRVGQIVRVVDDPDGPWVGRVRRVSVAANLPKIRQTVVLERHLGLPPGVYGPGATARPLLVASADDIDLDLGYEVLEPLAERFGGGRPPFVVTLRSGSLPPGLSIVGSELVGTPTAVGEYGGIVLRCVDAEYRQIDAPAFTIRVI
ncbi:hypothetical protein [Rubrivivax sp. JA1026]|uniref:hypothetical protein n=1 Tax=Rubrivivax sp. JA1026 TaxID=2710888 RepID=UPI0013E9627E|nr:hypothetical protein [Rubrivivax sp. JA1026]